MKATSFQSVALATAITLGFLSTPLQADTINFGDDKSEYSNDGECDDRRFIGVGMATDLDEDDNFHDATDCKEAYSFDRIKLWDINKAREATQCSAIKYGDDNSEWSDDGECDDFRFEGPGMSGVVAVKDIGHDALDCRKACDAGRVFIRNY